MKKNSISRGFKRIKSYLKKKELLPEYLQENPFVHTAPKVSKAREIKIMPIHKNKRKGKVNLVTISLSFPKKAIRTKDDCILSSKMKGLDIESCKRKIFYFEKLFAIKNFIAFKNSIKFAIDKYKANIICINELGMPSTKYKNYWIRSINYAKKIAENNKCFIVAGSMHDIYTFYNTAYLFFPGCKAYGECYHKQVSAHNVGEIISVPPQRSSIITTVFGLRLAILVCLDIADYSAVAAVIKDEKINLLIVISNTDWIEPLKRVALVISKAISGGVALVNKYTSKAELSSHLLMYGENEPITPIKSELLRRDGSRVTLYSLNINELNEKKYEHIETDQYLKWLFGLS